MARETIVRITDDLDGSPADETLTFGLRGTEYEVDLSAKNAARLEKAVSKYMDVGRRVGVPSRRGGPKPRTATAKGKEDLAAIRSWAQEQGYEVADRGRFSAEIRSAYDAGRS